MLPYSINEEIVWNGVVLLHFWSFAQIRLPCTISWTHDQNIIRLRSSWQWSYVTMKHVFLINFIQCSVAYSIIFIQFHLYRKCFGIGRHLLSAPTKKKVADSPKIYQTDRQYGTSSDWANAENCKIVMKQNASNCAIKETRCASFPL